MKYLVLSFKMTDGKFQNKGQFIYDSLFGNAYFVTLATLLVLVKAALEKYTAALAAAATNDRIAVALKNESRAELEALLKQMGLAVMAEAKGNEVMLVSSGYTLAKQREPRHITNPGNVILSMGLSTGQMIATVKAIYGAKSYVYQITNSLPTEETAWTSVTASSSKYVFENLVPGNQYWVRVAVVGGRKQIAYSNVGSWFAQ
jgi:hypothetical protein